MNPPCYLIPPSNKDTSAVRTKEKQEYLWRVISRIDEYIRSTNTKAAVLATFNTFLLSAIGVRLKELSARSGGLANWEGFPVFWFAVPAVLAALSLCWVVAAIFPYLGTDNRCDIGEGHTTSLIFFRDISEQDPDQYQTKLLNATNEDIVRDLIQQIQELSEGANQKFQRLRYSFAYLIFAVITFSVIYPLSL